MSCAVIGGSIFGDATQDAEGYRSYPITFVVESNDPTQDGPANALQASGLPAYGAPLSFRSNIDIYAWRRLDTKVKRANTSDDRGPSKHYLVECMYSSKPPDNKRCQNQEITDPLLTPAKISGTFTKYQEEATIAEVTIFDGSGNVTRYLRRVLNSAWEQIRGPQVEFDKNRLQIRITQNVATASQGYQLPGQMVDTVNESSLWGFPARAIKLSEAPWEIKYHGSCSYYYERTLTFDTSVQYDQFTGALVGGFDRDILDEGSKAIRGDWVGNVYSVDPTADNDNPQDYIRFKDRNGENCRAVLDGNGNPATILVGTGTVEPLPGTVRIKRYTTSNFLTLGIPTSF